MSKNYMSMNDELRKGDFLLSNNKKFKAVFQDDGNFVIYESIWKPVWASDTSGSDATRLCMQSDCNLVMYNPKEQARWNTSTYQAEVDWVRLTLNDEGKLVLEKKSQEIWNSDKNSGEKV